MSTLIGFVSFPCPAEISRPAGVFFSAVVESRTGADTWRVRLDGRIVVVTTTLDLVPGEALRLKLVSQQKDKWILQILSPPEVPSPAVEASPLMTAFLSRGLPLASEKLASWSRWLARVPATSDADGWAASLEARRQGPLSPWAQGLEPWLAWQSSLEKGQSEPPPQDDSYWDLWNSRNVAHGDPWLVTPMRWVHEGTEDGGLLQAHWNAQAQAIDQWNLTASPAQTPFRLEARAKPRRLDLTWHFFQEVDRRRWEVLSPSWASKLSSADLNVTLRVAGRPQAATVLHREGLRLDT